MWTWNSAPSFVYLFILPSCFSSTSCSLPSLPNTRNSYSLPVALVVLTFVKPFKCVPFLCHTNKNLHIIAFTSKSLLVTSFIFICMFIATRLFANFLFHDHHITT
ncbi:hypothetical protein VIGAN_07212700 [Vigna angularis var. angularis]|uniref:Uncharacterized protein n=1 Tax=Vigna angularis var. angularis TaxID=157739 RepID=A0A0S3SK68_PHAAN|nr:hypothetical protein VIGAN_07212700 [Vigna angularis var. angularis]